MPTIRVRTVLSAGISSTIAPNRLKGIKQSVRRFRRALFYMYRFFDFSPVFYFLTFRPMQNIEQIIRERSPFLKRDSVVFVELLNFFGSDARMTTDVRDLREFLSPKRLYKVVKVSENSWMKCAYSFIDRYPECLEALGMLRYYSSPGKFFWQDVEKSENIVANSLTFGSYGWAPDAFTVFENPQDENFSLTAIVAL